MKITCKTAHRLLVEKNDHSLTIVEQLQLLFHLPICKNCRNFSKQQAIIRAQLKAWKR